MPYATNAELKRARLALSKLNLGAVAEELADVVERLEPAYQQPSGSSMTIQGALRWLADQLAIEKNLENLEK